MDFNVRILTATAVNWVEFIDVMKPISGSPTRCLDDNKMTLDSPLALVTSLRNLTTDTNPKYVAKIIDGLFKHSQVGILVKGERVIVTRFLHNCCLNTSYILEKDNIAIAVVSGTLYDWYTVIIYGCSTAVTKEIRITFNECYKLFNYSDLRNLWVNYSKTPQLDGTFILEVRS